VNRLEKEIQELEEKLDGQTSEIRRLKRTLSRYEELLELTGVKDREAQESGAQRLVSAVMQLPYLNATTALGRAGELERLAERLQRPHRETPGHNVPKHLRPTNFGRTVANRHEAEERWQQAQELAAEAIADGLLSDAEWERWSSPVSGLSLEALVNQLEHLELVPLFAEELRAEVVAAVEGALVPAGFLERVQAKIDDVIGGFRQSTLPVPSDWSNPLGSVVAAGFQCLEKPWERKGLSREEWEAAGEVQGCLLPDRGIERDPWHSTAFFLTQCLTEGCLEDLRAFVQEGLETGELQEAYEICLKQGRPVVERVAA